MKTHQKMCWNCDGHVHVYELQCPYCGVDLTEKEKEEASFEEINVSEALEAESPQDMVVEEHPKVEIEDDYANPPFQDLIEDVEQEVIQETNWEAIAAEEKEPDLDNPLASLLLLLPGSLFFLFGLALFLFSEDGFLTFRFNAKYWFCYLMGSCFVLYLGWRSLFPARGVSRELSDEVAMDSSEAEEPEA
ncbi:MAG: hypothetical protein S4CHLAM7_06700 [Chlamydiae bacterium]|nr:hypothetical protein [Chlamydiota bacterium]